MKKSRDLKSTFTVRRRVHTRLKRWLLKLGKDVEDSHGNPYYKVYSGDTQPIDIRFRMKRIEYRPDVVWSRRGRLRIIEIALTEDWRAIVGEFTLASFIPNCIGFFIITVGDPEFTDNLFDIVGEKLGWRKWISYTFEEEDLSDLSKMKKDIEQWLEENRWIF
jgi:hypothetical protein